MRFSVSVPVLSVRIMLVAPRVSTADKRATSALRLAMRHIPLARAIVATIGSPSGTAATASAIPTSMESSASRPTSMLTAAMTKPITSTTHASLLPSASRRFSSGVCCASASVTSLVMRPSSVDMPMSTTTPFPEPRVMAVPLNTEFVRSITRVSWGNASVCLPTGNDSPVSVDSSACNLAASISRMSAVTMSPPSSTTMSPGTSWPAGISCTLPSRITTVFTEPSRLSASIERIARHSVRKPIELFIAMTANIASPSAKSANRNASTPATSSSRITTLLN